MQHARGKHHKYKCYEGSACAGYGFEDIEFKKVLVESKQSGRSCYHQPEIL